MSVSTEITLNKCTKRFADLVPTRLEHVRALPDQDEHEAEFNIAELGTTLGVLRGSSPSIGGGVEVLGRQRRGTGIGAPYRVDSAEVLIAHIGRWRVSLVGDGAAGSFEISMGGVVSVPAGALRRLELLDDVPGFLFAVRGNAQDAGLEPRLAVGAYSLSGGLSAVQGGTWIDDSAGVPVLRTLRAGEAMSFDPPPSGGSSLEGCVCNPDSMWPNPRSPFSSEGVNDAAVVVPKDTADGFAAGPIRGWWPHGFNLRLLTLASGAYVPAHRRLDALAVIVQDGTVEVRSCDECVILGAGDTLSMPAGREHALRNATSRSTRVFVVMASENPTNPDFTSLPIRGCY